MPSELISSSLASFRICQNRGAHCNAAPQCQSSIDSVVDRAVRAEPAALSVKFPTTFSISLSPGKGVCHVILSRCSQRRSLQHLCPQHRLEKSREEGLMFLILTAALDHLLHHALRHLSVHLLLLQKCLKGMNSNKTFPHELPKCPRGTSFV